MGALVREGAMVGRPYSEGFRRRVLEEGAARRFKVGASSAIRWKKRLDATGSAAGEQEPVAAGGARAAAVGADCRGA